MSGLSGSVIELSNYLEQKISQKSADYAAVRYFDFSFIIYVPQSEFKFAVNSHQHHSMKSARLCRLVTVLPVFTV